MLKSKIKFLLCSVLFYDNDRLSDQQMLMSLRICTESLEHLFLAAIKIVQSKYWNDFAILKHHLSWT